MEFSFMFFLGFLFGSLVLEPIIINLVYMSNVDLFLDLILTKKNEDKLIKRILELKDKDII